MSEKIINYEGTRIPTQDLKAGKVPVIKWSPKVKYAWSAGIAMSRFLKELKNGKLIARKCNKCGRIMIPPRMYCAFCFRPTNEWVFVKDSGVINTFSISFLATDASRIKEPIVSAIIEIDGASKGMGILHLLKVDSSTVQKLLKGEDLLFDRKVQAVWKPPRDREGKITDIQHFELVEVKQQ